jgi:AbrB family looped-hinge helix DNA binding protein
MKTTIDRFGRVVVPKEIRKHFGLAPGGEVEIDERDHEIVIRQVAGYSPLQMEEIGRAHV